MATTLIKKLRLNYENKSLILNAPDGFIENLGGLNPDTKTDGKYNFVLLFIQNSEEWEKFGKITIASINFDAVFWVCYPKKNSKIKSDLSRNMMWELVGKDSGLRPVSQIAIDETWSALRFRPNDKVGK